MVIIQKKKYCSMYRCHRRAERLCRLKDVAKDYLASVGKADEKAKAEKLIAALNECVESIDDVLPFFASDKAKELFGEEQAAALLKKGQEVKAAGGDTCFCRPAPTANSCSTIMICYWDELRETCSEGKCVYILKGAGACISASSLR